jgi:hypothetical protein
MDIVNRWSSEVGNEGIKVAMGLENDWPKDLHIFRIALSRHFAHSLKSIKLGEDTAFATWPQFFNSNQIVKRDYSDPMLKDLVSLLRDHQEKPEKITHLEEPTTQWKIGNLTFSTMQEAAECT